MATDKIFIDRDLTLTNTHVTIMAPTVEVVGAGRTLNLKGSKGANFRTCATPGARGLDGNPGSSSGDATIFALNVVNAHALTIHSMGGDGSDGQAGGHGLNGQPSSPPELPNLSGTEENIYNRIHSQNYKVENWNVTDTKTDLSGRVISKEVYLIVSNEIGGWAPTNGAAGGDGGAAALPGDLNISIRNAATQISTESSTGKSGEGGVGGHAGQRAATCAKTAFNCQASRRKTSFLSMHRPFTFDCSTLVKKYYCETKFPLALEGKDGTNVPNLAARSYKFPVTTGIEKQVQRYLRNFRAFGCD
jgi:hypothetical protein